MMNKLLKKCLKKFSELKNSALNKTANWRKKIFTPDDGDFCLSELFSRIKYMADKQKSPLSDYNI